MREIPFEQLPYAEVSVADIRGLWQQWQDKAVYSYLSCPRPDSGLTLFLCGSADYTFPNGSLHATEGMVIAIPEGTYYSVKFNSTEPGKNVRTLLVNYRLFSDTGEGVIHTGCPTLLLRDSQGTLQPLFRATVEAACGRDRLLCREMFFRMLNRICRMVRKGEGQPSFSSILDDMEDHLGDFPGVPVLCARFGMSQSGLRRLFAQQLHMTPVAYLAARRIARAKELLLTSEMTTETICAQLGFYDAAYFYKCFRRATGMTPGEFAAGAKMQARWEEAQET